MIKKESDGLFSKSIPITCSGPIARFLGLPLPAFPMPPKLLGISSGIGKSSSLRSGELAAVGEGRRSRKRAGLGDLNEGLRLSPESDAVGEGEGGPT